MWFWGHGLLSNHYTLSSIDKAVRYLLFSFDPWCGESMKYVLKWLSRGMFGGGLVEVLDVLGCFNVPQLTRNNWESINTYCHLKLLYLRKSSRSAHI